MRLAVVQPIRQFQFVRHFLLHLWLVLFIGLRQQVARFRFFGSVKGGRAFDLARLVQLLLVEFRFEQLLLVYLAFVEFLGDQFAILFLLAVHRLLVGQFRLHRAVLERDHRSHWRVILLDVDLCAG